MELILRLKLSEEIDVDAIVEQTTRSHASVLKKTIKLTLVLILDRIRYQNNQDKTDFKSHEIKLYV